MMEQVPGSLVRSVLTLAPVTALLGLGLVGPPISVQAPTGRRPAVLDWERVLFAHSIQPMRARAPHSGARTS